MCSGQPLGLVQETQILFFPANKLVYKIDTFRNSCFFRVFDVRIRDGKTGITHDFYCFSLVCFGFPIVSLLLAHEILLFSQACFGFPISPAWLFVVSLWFALVFL